MYWRFNLKKILLFTLLILIASFCSGGKIILEESLSFDNTSSPSLSITHWHWHKSPVIIPGGSLWVGFTARNESDDTLDLERFCRESSIILIGPENDTLFAEGDKLVEIADYIKDIDPNSVNTVVFEIQNLFEFDRIGNYLLIWVTSLGYTEYNIHVLEELDYLFYRFKHDVAYNEWGLHLYGLDGSIVIHDWYLSAKLVNYGEKAIIKLLPYLNDESDCFIEGSEDATIGSLYSYRKMDFAAIMIAKILDI